MAYPPSISPSARSEVSTEQAKSGSAGVPVVAVVLRRSPRSPPPPPAVAAGESRFLFIGNGLYCGDGGSELQRLWSGHAWKPLNGCDGRFVCRDKSLAPMSLTKLADALRLNAASPIVRCRDVGDGDGDAIDVVRLRGGGGILTYAKAGTDSTPPRYVHTLNTESGLSRKLIAIGGDGLCALIDAIQPNEAGLVFGALTRILQQVPDDGERTRTGPAIAAALRFGLARAATREGPPRTTSEGPPRTSSEAVRPISPPPSPPPFRALEGSGDAQLDLHALEIVFGALAPHSLCLCCRVCRSWQLAAAYSDAYAVVRRSFNRNPIGHHHDTGLLGMLHTSVRISLTAFRRRLKLL